MSCNLIQLPVQRSIAMLGDPYWDKVVALLHFEGAVGTRNYVDQKGHAFGGGSAPMLSADQVKFGGTSLVLANGSSGISATSADFVIGLDAFTMECWIYRTGASQYSSNGLDSLLGAGAYGGNAGLSMNAAGNVYSIAGGNIAMTSTIKVPFNKWTHLALERMNGYLVLFIDGVHAGEVASNANLTASTFSIGDGATSGIRGYFKGFVDELRITKGVARYTSAFTPSLEAFPNN